MVPPSSFLVQMFPLMEVASALRGETFASALPGLVHRSAYDAMDSSQPTLERGLHLSDIFARAADSTAVPGTTRKLLESFRICGACTNFQRLGEANDGGYLTCMDRLQDGHIRAAYSFGVEGHDKWSEDISSLLKVPVNQFDCTVKSAPEGCTNCKFFPKCIKSADGTSDSFPGRSWSLKEVLAASNMSFAPPRSLLLKMDIEGSEWPVLVGEPSSEDLVRFQGISVEFHSLERVEHHQQQLTAVQKLLNAGFRVVHIHGNNHAGSYTVGDFRIPKVLEVSFEAGGEPRDCSKKQEYLALDGSNAPGSAEMAMAKLP